LENLLFNSFVTFFMESSPQSRIDDPPGEAASSEPSSISSLQVEAVLAQLGGFLGQPSGSRPPTDQQKQIAADEPLLSGETLPSMDARYRVLVEQIPAVVFMAFLDGGISEAYVSPHIEETLGFSREEWLDDPIRWYQQIHPEDRLRWSIESAEMFMTGNQLKSMYRVIARDGRTVWFHCEAKMVRRKDGQPWFIHGVGFDITELKLTEQALKQESAERERLQKLELDRQIEKTEQTESRLAAIVESSDDAIVGNTLDGFITTWNAAATRMFGYKASEIIGKSVLVLIPPQQHSEELAILGRLKAGERIEHYDTERVTKSGDLVDVSLTVSPIKDAAGRVVGVSKIARDITQRKKMEQALRNSEKYAAMGRVAAVLAHEIHNPLEALTNTFYLLRKHSSLDQQGQELAQIANVEITRVSRIAKQTLGLYRQSERPTIVSLDALLSDILEFYAKPLQLSQIAVEKVFAVDGRILGFSGEMRQVFLNLISNAIQAMPESGKLRVHIHNSRDWTRSGSRSGVRVNVVDTGVGIRPEDRDRIFQPFFTTKAEKGTGLGLWVSRGIIQKLDGSIRVRSCAFGGKTATCFSVFLPTEIGHEM
jgi:PAS domain S-box-containing protein